MNSKRLFFVLSGLVGLLLVGLVAGANGASQLLKQRADSLVKLKAQSQALDKEQITLRTAKKQVAAYADLNQIAHAVVPQDKNQAEAVREIVNLANANSVTLDSITFPASSLGTSASGSASSAAPKQASPAGGAINSKTDALSQLVPVKNIPGVYLLQIVVTGDPNRPVPYDKFINFLAALEHNRRTAQVSQISLIPDVSNRSLLSFNLTLNEYIKP